jgi:holo-[acyl-carrier protein] synthase
VVRAVGLDIVETKRIAQLLAQHDQRFIDRLLGPDEQALLTERADRAQFIAGRFAAKEAIIKALADVLDERPPYRQIQVVKDVAGKPVTKFDEPLARHLNAYRFLLSISHERSTAAAVAILTDAT